jgi:hypothetical protein
MGLLDDAIRDHLELKRLRGADPGEVAREQKEALTPVLGDDAEQADDEPILELEDFHLASDLPVAPEPAHGGQETAELDMATVLGEAQTASPEEPVPEGLDIKASQPEPLTERADDDVIGWERPQGSSAATPADPDTTTIP